MLIERLHELVKRHPERLAVIHGNTRLDYAGLWYSVLALAERLRASGVREGDFVCMQLPNGADFVISFFAVVAARGVAIPMDPALTAEERRRYLDGITPAAIINEQARQPASYVDSDCPVLQARTPDGMDLDPPGIPHYGPVLCQFSSGSTGLPKRVIRTQQHLVQEYRQLTAVLGTDEQDAVAAVVPLHHAHGFGNALLFAICNGLRLVIPRPPGPENNEAVPLRFWRGELLNFLAAEGVTILPAVPYVFDMLAGAPKLPTGLRLRLCLSAGSALTAETSQRFQERFNVPIRQLYGCTEAGSITVNGDAEPDLCWNSVGKPLPGVELRLEGEEGLITFRSAAMASGYHGAAADSSPEFRGGWFYPGDIGSMDQQGRLYIKGRYRRFIDTSGFKVDPSEVEQILDLHEGVKEVVVFGVPHDAIGEMVKAVIVPNKGMTLETDELFELCRRHLAGYKWPRLLEMRESLPRSPMGKVLIKELI